MRRGKSKLGDWTKGDGKKEIGRGHENMRMIKNPEGDQSGPTRKKDTVIKDGTREGWTLLKAGGRRRKEKRDGLE